MIKPTISYNDFSRLDLRVGTILRCEEVEGSHKLYKLLIDLGSEGKRTILSGIKSYFSPEDLVGNQVLVLANLQPKRIMGLESEGMILMAVEKENGEEKGVTLLIPQKRVKEGVEVE